MTKKLFIRMYGRITLVSLASLTLIGLFVTNSYGQAVEQDPYKEGGDYLLAHNYDEAIPAFNDAIKINPKNAKAYLGLAVAYLNTYKFDKAISNYTKVLELYSGHDNSIIELAYEGRGAAYIKTGDADKAIADTSKALEIDSNSDAAYNLRAHAYLMKGNTALALSSLNQEIERNPKKLDAYLMRVAINLIGGKYDDVIADCNHVIKAQPDSADAYSARAAAYYGKKLYDKAWDDVHKQTELGLAVTPEFLHDLRRDSGREK